MLTGIIVAFLFQLFGPNPKIIVSEETTVITSPLREEGLPDYQAYWRDLGREGTTHENNAAVLFWQAVWPGELEGDDRRLMMAALGLEKEPESGESLQTPYDEELRKKVSTWFAASYEKGQSQQQIDALTNPENPEYVINQAAVGVIVEELIDSAMSRPWTSEQIPPLAEWVARNEKPLDVLVEASRRPKWWSPSPSLLKDPYVGSIAAVMEDIQLVRNVARAFGVRAMWHTGERRPREAWTDLKASFRFARFMGEGPTLVEHLVAVAIDGITLNHTVTLLQHGEIDAELAREILAHLSAMEKSYDMARSFDEGERLFFVDTILMVARDGNQLAGLDLEAGPLGLERFSGLSIDWNHVLREGNRWYDRLVEAARIPGREERLAAFADLNDDVEAISTKSPTRLVASFFSIRSRTSLVSDLVISLFLPALEGAINAEDRAAAQLDMTRVAAALAVHRAEQGEYPERLEQLVPGVMAQVPNDLYSGKPFIYRRRADGGYLLYSLFENGKDDGGTDYRGEIVKGEWVEEAGDLDYKNSDLVIRVPMPKFEVPEMPKLVSD